MCWTLFISPLNVDYILPAVQGHAIHIRASELGAIAGTHMHTRTTVLGIMVVCGAGKNTFSRTYTTQRTGLGIIILFTGRARGVWPFFPSQQRKTRADPPGT